MPGSEGTLSIALLAPSPEVRGPVGKHTRHLVSALRDLGCAVALLPWGRASDRDSALKRAADRLTDAFAVRRLLRAGSFDVLVVKTAHDWATISRDLLLVALCRRMQPVVLQCHGSAPERLVGQGGRIFRLASRLLASRVDLVMLLSTEEQRGWASIAGNVPLETFRNPYVRKSTLEEPGETELRFPARLLIAGRVIREKGAGELISAAARLKDLDLEVVVAGDGPDRSRLEALAQDSDVRASFLGHLSSEEMGTAYERADVFVLPTRWFEGFPTVITEAMDFGVPIITTRIRGMADHLVDGTNALLVEPGDESALAAAIERLVADPELRRRMVRANFALLERFSPPVVAAELLDTLGRATVGRGSPRKSSYRQRQRTGHRSTSRAAAEITAAASKGTPGPSRRCESRRFPVTRMVHLATLLLDAGMREAGRPTVSGYRTARPAVVS